MVVVYLVALQRKLHQTYHTCMLFILNGLNKVKESHRIKAER